MLFLLSCFGGDGLKVVCSQTYLMNLIFFCEYTGKMTLYNIIGNRFGSITYISGQNNAFLERLQRKHKTILLKNQFHRIKFLNQQCRL